MTTNSNDTVSVKDSLRGAIFSSKNRELKKEIIIMFGNEVEVRQPNLGQITALGREDDKTAPIFKIMIEYCYVPGTNEKVFSKADVAALSELPAGQWLTDFNSAIEKLTSIDISSAEKNLEETTSGD